MHRESHILHKNNKNIKFILKIIHKTEIKLFTKSQSNNQFKNRLILRKKKKNWFLWGQLPNKTVQTISQLGIFLTKGSKIWNFHSPPKNH